jgi:hypothetical protein
MPNGSIPTGSPANGSGSARLVRLLTALAAVAGALGTGGSVYQWRGAEGERASVARENAASVQLLQGLSAIYTAELARAQERDERCWRVLHGGGMGPEPAIEPAPMPEITTPPGPDVVLHVAAEPGLEPAPAPKLPKLKRLQRYDWWEGLPPQVQSLVPGYVPPEPELAP